MLDPQLKRGLLDHCVLAALCRGDSYGYQIIKDLSGSVALSESTLYPILRRLEQGGALSSYSVEHNGRLRKFYHLPLKYCFLILRCEKWMESNLEKSFVSAHTRHLLYMFQVMTSICDSCLRQSHFVFCQNH